MTAGPLVSVVMPTYRRADHVRSTLASLSAQSLDDFELLVRDDGDGSDGTEPAVRAAAAGDARIAYHRNAVRLGMPENLNAGIRAARGRFIAVCHDHDLYHPEFLATMVAMLERHPSALFVHCAIDMVDGAGRRTASHVGDWPALTPGRQWLRFMLSRLSCPVCALTVVRRDTHDRHGLYDPQYGFIADIEMWMRLAAHGDVAYVSRPLISVREREPDAPAFADGVGLLRTLQRIHARYVPEAFRGPARALALARLAWSVELQVWRARLVTARRAIRRRRPSTAPAPVGQGMVSR